MKYIYLIFSVNYNVFRVLKYRVDSREEFENERNKTH